MKGGGGSFSWSRSFIAMAVFSFSGLCCDLFDDRNALESEEIEGCVDDLVGKRDGRTNMTHGLGCMSRLSIIKMSLSELL